MDALKVCLLTLFRHFSLKLKTLYFLVRPLTLRSQFQKGEGSKYSCLNKPFARASYISIAKLFISYTVAIQMKVPLCNLRSNMADFVLFLSDRVVQRSYVKNNLK